MKWRTEVLQPCEPYTLISDLFLLSHSRAGDEIMCSFSSLGFFFKL